MSREVVTYVLDASAILRFLDEEAGADEVTSILKAHAVGPARILTSAVQWGEVVSVLCRRNLSADVEHTLERLTSIGFEVVSATPQLAVRSAIVQCTLKLPYADSFVIAVSEQFQQATVVTTDYDFKVADHLAPMQFLALKPK